MTQKKGGRKTRRPPIQKEGGVETPRTPPIPAPVHPTNLLVPGKYVGIMQSDWLFLSGKYYGIRQKRFGVQPTF